MAAIRCAARRIGGSLLQRTQAAVVEEGPRRLAPSRLMRSRQLSSQVSGERAGKILKKEELDFEEMKAVLDTLAELQKEAGPSVFLMRMMSIGRAAKTVVVGAAKLTLVYVAAAVAFGGDGVEAEAATKENQ
ncbi:hypothetical protein CFC21_009497 [Triticum aestivum]|uniref:Uncharacterized protein n=2 Tax=Triticum aestivum TaxID=4565 RepID=A0A3B5Z712_WHEAT|nr:uncharacterized protein LOC123149745 isoform X1 [Triticum aestivum]KAF6992512.1 hypothetical protein CFC21_009497 [Triticum aestivum]